jgi:hypothetical protein
MSRASLSSQSPRRLRPALTVTLTLVLLPCPAVHALEVQPAGLRLPGLGEILSPLVDLISHFWEKAGSGLDPNGSPQGDEGSDLDPNGAPSATGSEAGSGLDPDGVH